MSRSYEILTREGAQTGREDSFIGGRPRLPPAVGLPGCSLCGALQTFFLQIALPDDHAWAGYTVAVFHCTSCARKGYFIPEMLRGTLRAPNVPAEFLSVYQRNFRFLVFQTDAGELAASYVERVRFRPVLLVPGDGATLGRVGGRPVWIEDDEAPGSVASMPAVFLLQLGSHIEFETVPGSPRQVELNLFGAEEPSPDAFYRLFLGNVTYMFGAETPADHRVYAITQVA